jgi:hypothetical protein
VNGWDALDASTRRFWRVTGRPVDLTGVHSWLDAPTADRGRVEDAWLLDAGARAGGGLRLDDPSAGLLPDVSALAGPTFDVTSLDAGVRDFYEHTAQWRMDAWSQWSAPFLPGGALITALFGRRLQQLALPVRPLEVSRGIDSTVVPVLDADGRQVWAGWVRRLRSTGDHLFSGAYRATTLPGHGPVVHVAFPLQRGNVQVFLTPSLRADGALVLDSPRGRFGDPGAYVAVRSEPGAAPAHHAARVPIHERFVIYRDGDALRTDHHLWLRRALVVRLHYRMERLA